MTAGQGQRTIDGISRRSMLRGATLAAAGVATAGVMSAALTGTAKATFSPQVGWGFCHLCSALFWTKGGGINYCVAARGGPHRQSSGSYIYELDSGNPTDDTEQEGWRWCSACSVLYFGGHSGSCWGNMDGLQGHILGSATNYDVLWNGTGLGTTTDPQTFWRWCTACSTLYWQGNTAGNTGGICPANGVDVHYGGPTIYNVFWSGNY